MCLFIEPSSHHPTVGTMSLQLNIARPKARNDILLPAGTSFLGSFELFISTTCFYNNRPRHFPSSHRICYNCYSPPRFLLQCAQGVYSSGCRGTIFVWSQISSFPDACLAHSLHITISVVLMVLVWTWSQLFLYSVSKGFNVHLNA